MLGVVSAGAFVADKVSSKATATPHGVTTSNLLPRAQSQATSIVRAAQTAGHHIMATATSKGKKQARAIVTTAKRETTAQPVVVPTAQSVVPTAASGIAATPFATQATGSVTTGATRTSGINLGSLPATWLVVAYNATFGTGPGSAGGITVTNRSGKRFSGVVRIAYTRGGQAMASFSGLSAGSTEVLPLNGPRYAGGGFRILVLHPH